MPAAIGSEVGLYYDGFEVVEEGDVVKTATTGRCYRTISNRIQAKGIHKGRQHLRVQVIDPADVTEDDKVHLLHWYSRNKR